MGAVHAPVRPARKAVFGLFSHFSAKTAKDPKSKYLRASVCITVEHGGVHQRRFVKLCRGGGWGGGRDEGGREGCGDSEDVRERADRGIERECWRYRAPSLGQSWTGSRRACTRSMGMGGWCIGTTGPSRRRGTCGRKCWGGSTGQSWWSRAKSTIRWCACMPVRWRVPKEPGLRGGC